MVANRANTCPVIMRWHLFDRTLPIEEMPAHGHDASISSVGDHSHTIPHSLLSSDGGNLGYWAARPRGMHDTGGGGTHGHTVTISSVGSGQKANNMQPYVAVYYWHRTN